MKTKKKKGFTLTELIVVIVIIGVLAAVIIPSLTGYITKAQNSNDETLVTLLNQELEHQKLLNEDLEFYTAYDVNAFLKEVNRENIEVANKKSIILFDTEINQFVLVKEDEQSKALVKTNFVYHISEYYSINHDFYDEEDENKPQEVKLGYSKLSNSKCDKTDCETHRAFIISINGPEIAKVVKAVMDLPIDNNGSNALEVLKELDADTYKLAISSITKTVYVNKSNTFYYNDNLEMQTYKDEEYDATNADQQKLTRVIILPDVEEVDLSQINNLEKCLVIIPDTASTVSEDNINLKSGCKVVGNVNSSKNYTYNELYSELEKNELNFISSYIYSESQLYDWLKKYDSQLITDNKIIICNDITIKTEVTIKKDVILFIPYSDENTNIDDYITNKKIPESVNKKTGDSYFVKLSAEDNSKKNVELCIDSSGIVNVYGTIVIGGVTGAETDGLCGHTSDFYGQIKNDGIINMKSDSVLDCYGYITGDGKINTEENVSIYEPFIIGDFAGGTNTALLSAKKTSTEYINDNGCTTPFALYALVNIQCEINIIYNSFLYGYTRFFCDSLNFGNGDYIDNTITMIGNTSNSFMNLDVGSSVKITYDEETAIDFKSNDFKNVGKTKMSISGSVSTGSIQIEFKGIDLLNNTEISSNEFLLPIPYNFSIEFLSGTSYIKNRLAFLPGSELYVSDKATLEVSNDAELYIFDKLADLYGKNKTYFSCNYYLEYPSNEPAKIIVDGTLNIYGVFGGIIQTNGNTKATVMVDTNAVVDGTKKATFGSGTRKYSLYTFLGYIGYTCTKQNYCLKGMIVIDDNLVELINGSTYCSANNKSYSINDYSTTYYYNKISITKEKVLTSSPPFFTNVDCEDWDEVSNTMTRSVDIVGGWEKKEN